MGLDQYAYKRKVKWSKDYKTKTTVDKQIMYWRKHNRLQGWFENFHADVIECKDVYVSLDDILLLEKAIDNKELPQTEGFFYGGDSYEDYKEWGYEEQDQKFLQLAKKAINEDYEIIYGCSY
tara:strand:- start:186 stop:551 length:366 start_codon:yes stop_codon:yes gene_type:complete